jgi:tetratricopeptide (TPR) repeat protein
MDKNFTNNEELLVRLLDGELGAAEKQSVEQQLATDKKLQGQYDSLLLAKESLRQYGLTQKVAGIHQQMMDEMQVPVRKINPVKRLVRLSTAIAAGVILLIGGFWLYNNSQTVSGDKVFASNYHTYEIATVRDNAAETDLEKAYRAKNFREVIRLSEATEDKSIQSSFLAGVAALEIKENNKAIKNLTGVLQINKTFGQTLYKDDAEYYLALSHLRAADYIQALDLLQNIKNEPAHKYYGQVTYKLISQVKRLKNK